jgi:hypothetical protein
VMGTHDPENSSPATQLSSESRDSIPIAALCHGFWAAMFPYIHGQSCVTNGKATCPVGQRLAAASLCGNRDRALGPFPVSLPVLMRELEDSSRRDSSVGATLHQTSRRHPLGRVPSKVETVSLNLAVLANSRRSHNSCSANVESSCLHHHIVLDWVQADATARLFCRSLWRTTRPIRLTGSM